LLEKGAGRRDGSPFDRLRGHCCITGDGLVTDRDIVFVAEKMRHKSVVIAEGARCWCYCNAAQNDTARDGVQVTVGWFAGMSA